VRRYARRAWNGVMCVRGGGVSEWLCLGLFSVALFFGVPNMAPAVIRALCCRRRRQRGGSGLQGKGISECQVCDYYCEWIHRIAYLFPVGV